MPNRDRPKMVISRDWHVYPCSKRSTLRAQPRAAPPYGRLSDDDDTMSPRGCVDGADGVRLSPTDDAPLVGCSAMLYSPSYGRVPGQMFATATTFEPPAERRDSHRLRHPQDDHLHRTPKTNDVLRRPERTNKGWPDPTPSGSRGAPLFERARCFTAGHGRDANDPDVAKQPDPIRSSPCAATNSGMVEGAPRPRRTRAPRRSAMPR
jgi:hypothetical protein